MGDHAAFASKLEAISEFAFGTKTAVFRNDRFGFWPVSVFHAFVYDTRMPGVYVQDLWVDPP